MELRHVYSLFVNFGILHAVNASAHEHGIPTSPLTVPENGWVIRLAMDQNEKITSGRLEVLSRSGKYGPLCADKWSINEASTACRQLGFRRGALKATKQRSSGNWQRSDLLIGEAKCNEHAQSLRDCEWINSNRCLTGLAAGVICQENKGIVLTVSNKENCSRTTTLSCETDATSPLNCSLQTCGWYKDDMYIVINGIARFPHKYEQDIEVNNLTLRIINTDFSDNGFYRCSIGFDISNYVTLKVGLKLTGATNARCLNAWTIYCEINPYSNPDTKINISWYKDNTLVYRNETLPTDKSDKYKELVGVNNHSLVINNINMADMGRYQCSDGQERSNCACLNIEYGTDVLQLSPNTTSYTVYEDDLLAPISCSVVCCPNCSYTWTKDDKHTVKLDSELNLGRVTRNMSGRYICTALYTALHASRAVKTVDIIVYYSDHSPFYPSAVTVGTVGGIIVTLAAIVCLAVQLK